MRVEFEAEIAREQAGIREVVAIVLDAAILLETGWDDLCDLVVFVDAPPTGSSGWRGAAVGPPKCSKPASPPSGDSIASEPVPSS